MHAKLLELCLLTLGNAMDCGPPGSSVCGILQARILEWVAISFSRGSSQPRDGTLITFEEDFIFPFHSLSRFEILCVAIDARSFTFFRSPRFCLLVVVLLFILLERGESLSLNSFCHNPLLPSSPTDAVVRGVGCALWSDPHKCLSSLQLCFPHCSSWLQHFQSISLSM